MELIEIRKLGVTENVVKKASESHESPSRSGSSRFSPDGEVCGLRFMVYGLWLMVCGLWFMVCGVWFMAYG